MGTINACLEIKGREGCGVKPVLGICLVEATGISIGTVEVFLIGGLQSLNGDCYADFFD